MASRMSVLDSAEYRYLNVCKNGTGYRVPEQRSYRPRLVDGLIADLLEELPAILLTGPRATGKTTTAIRYAKSVVRLDREAEAAAFRADPDAALRCARSKSRFCWTNGRSFQGCLALSSAAWMQRRNPADSS